MKPVVLILARHAESDLNGQNRIQGHLDSGLTARGKRQAGRLARHLRSFGIRKIYSSDLGRAKATARLIQRLLRRNVVYDPGLREIHLGSWEGLSPGEVNEQFNNGFEEWRQSPSRMVIPGGETVREFRKRVTKTLREIFRKESHGPVLVVTHGGYIASAIAEALDADFDRALLDLRFDNTGLSAITMKGNRFLVHVVNDTPHLTPQDKPHATGLR